MLGGRSPVDWAISQFPMHAQRHAERSASLGGLPDGPPLLALIDKRKRLLMPRALLLVLALAMLGCAGDRWAQEGMSEAQLERDKAECQSFATASPGSTRGGLSVTRRDLSETASTPSSVDVILGVRTSTARTDAFDRCMAERGWRQR
jgi:hypothetical protein